MMEMIDVSRLSLSAAPPHRRNQTVGGYLSSRSCRRASLRRSSPVGRKGAPFKTGVRHEALGFRSWFSAAKRTARAAKLWLFRLWKSDVVISADGVRFERRWK